MERYLKPTVAELVGTFCFFFIGAGSIIASVQAHMTGGSQLLIVALAHGLMLSIMVSIFGATSGGHFNPAVTISFLVTQRISAALAALYVLAQLVGGTLAGLALRLVFPVAAWHAARLGTPNLAPGVSFGTGVVLEGILTFFLVLAVFGTAVDARAPKIAGFGIGLTVLADILVGGPVTGASMNPARTFGPALAGGYWNNDLVYWIGPIIGGAIAALFYEHIIIRPVGSQAAPNEA